MEVLLWASLCLILYGYLGYPILISIIYKISSHPIKKDPAFLPTVSVIIPAHNEVKIIEKKLNNALEIDYPKDRLEIIVASDASTDGTDEIVKGYEDRGISIIRLEPRGGKNRAVNAVVPQAKGEIAVLCDANIMFDPLAIRNLVRNFADPVVGCVCGRKIYQDNEAMATGKGEGLYWRLEEYLKRCESAAGSVTGADGSMYAIRRELFVPFDIALMDDFLISLNIFQKGYRIVSEPEARAFEKATTLASDEFRRKNRIVATTIRSLTRYPHFLNPFRSGRMAWQIWSHKICRWLVPFFLFTSAVALVSLAIQGRYVWMATAAALLLLAGGIGGLLQRAGKPSGGFSLPFYFLLVNAAAMVGWVKYLVGKVETTWKKPESSRV